MKSFLAYISWGNPFIVEDLEWLEEATLPYKENWTVTHPNDTYYEHIRQVKKEYPEPKGLHKQLSAYHKLKAGEKGQRTSLHDYTGIGSGEINRKLARGSKHNRFDKETMAGLEQTIHNAKPLHKAVTVYSGIGRNRAKNFGEHLKSHMGHFVTPTYVSSSLNVDVAASDFSRELHRKNEQHQHVIAFHLPKGYKNGRYIASASGSKYEHEFLLNKGQKWRIHEHRVYGPNKDEAPKHWTKEYLHVWHVHPE